ncbi:MAG: L-rhamnonate dehydratase [Candidatus Poribacteria bacterium]|nr:L-rhamnonate dehydratase [Candidatus Poribacteria bacterium]
MKIKQLRAVSVKIPQPTSKSKARRPGWNECAPRAFPINKYAEFSGFHATTPGSKLNTPIWVQVTADDGTWGLGRCGFGTPVAALIDSHFAPLLEGRDAMALELLNDLMWRSTQLFGASGIASIAQSGVDLALWDLKGKLLKQPVYKLLGGPSREKVALYCTSDDLDWSKELGFRAFKVSNPVTYEMGTEGLHLLEEKIAKAREEVGANAELMFNPVMSFNVEFTLRLADRLRPYGLRWLEEPLIPSDLEGHIELKRAITWIPLATGEHHHRRQAFRQLVENRAVDIVQPDIEWCGGLSEAIKIYTIAEAAGISTIPHTGAGTPWGQHFGIAMPESPMAEFWMGSDPGIPLDEVCPIPGMPVPVNGDVIPSDAPGFGMEIAANWIEPLSSQFLEPKP